MELNEKLQPLRKNKGLTQEELAQEIFVSRTAVSKWESGRGYPNIDSLKGLAKFFSVTVDELISPDEIISAAENEKQELIGRYTSLLCNILDIFTVLLLFIPIFGNGTQSPPTVSLFAISGSSLWIRLVYAVVIAITVLNGVCGMFFSRFDKPMWNKYCLFAGIALSVIACLIFIIARQPYAGIFIFAILLIQGWLLIRKK